MLHYYAHYNDRTAEILEALADRFGVASDTKGGFISKGKLVGVIEMFLEITNNSPSHRYRSEKVRHFLEHVVTKAPDDSEFYVHVMQ